jgi:hypothetical protein
MFLVFPAKAGIYFADEHRPCRRDENDRALRFPERPLLDTLHRKAN